MSIRGYISAMLNEFNDEVQYDKKVLKWNELQMEVNEDKNLFYRELGDLIMNGNETQTLNTVQFLIYLIENEAFDFQNEQVDHIFFRAILKGKSYPNPPEIIFKIICSILFKENILQKYINDLLQECGNEIERFQGEFSMTTLFYLLDGILDFSIGIRPKPKIENRVKVCILEKTERFLNRWMDPQFHKSRAEKQNYSKYYTLLCDYTTLYSKIAYNYVLDFRVEEQTLRNFYKLVSRNGIDNDNLFEVDVLFDLLAELMRNEFENYCQKKIFSWLIKISDKWILKCSSINFFWSKYIDRLGKEDLRYASGIELLTKLLYYKLKQRLQEGDIYLEKLPLAENLSKLRKVVATSIHISQSLKETIKIYSQNPEDSFHFPLIDIVSIILTKDIKGSNVPHFEKESIQTILANVIENFQLNQGNIHEYQDTQKNRFLDNITAILIMIKFCWTPLFEKNYLEKIFGMFVDMHFSYDISLIKYLNDLLSKLKKSDYLNHFLEYCDEFVLNILNRLNGNIEIKEINEIGDLLSNIFSLLKKRNRCLYVIRICQILKKIKRRNESLCNAAELCIKVGEFQSYNQFFNEMVIEIIDLVLKNFRSLNMKLLIILAKNFYHVGFVNARINEVEGEIKEILDRDIEGKNQINFIQYKILKLQIGHGQGSFLTNIYKKIAKPNQSQENLEIFMKYIIEHLKKLEVGPEKKNKWSDIQKTVLAFVEGMNTILVLEKKNSLIEKLKKIIILSKNLWKIFENSFDAAYEKIRRSKAEESLTQKMDIFLHNFYSCQKESVNCQNEYKVVKLYCLGISLKIFAKWNYVPDDGYGTLKLEIMKEKLQRWREVKEIVFKGQELKNLQKEIVNLGVKVAMFL